MTTDDIVNAIRAALAPDATPEARTHGVNTCRAILQVLEANAAPTPAPQSPPPDIASLIGAVRQMQPEQLLDLAITRLRAALPADAQVAPVRPIKFHIVPVPPSPKRGA